MNKLSDNPDDIAYILIDPPVTSFSSEKDIFAWIVHLKILPDLHEVRDTLSQAEDYIKMKKEFGE